MSGVTKTADGHPTGGVDQLLRQHGVQVTAQRLAIMRAVSARPHATADELTDEVRAVIGSISRQAVYDTLGVLVDKRLVRRIQPAGSAARYEDRVDDNHHHLICRSCGMTFDIACAIGAMPCLTADDDHGFEIDEAEVIYWGHCPPCRNAAPPPIPYHHNRSTHSVQGASND
jgi:Fur family ferric uptake transcriptional regulator